MRPLNWLYHVPRLLGKRVPALLLFALLLYTTVSAQIGHLEVCRFVSMNGAASQPYVEIYMGIDTRNVPYQPSEDGFVRKVDISLQLFQLPDSVLLFEEAKTLTTVVVQDSMLAAPLLRLQTRKPLGTGNYGLRLDIKPAGASSWTNRVQHFFYLADYQPDSLLISDVALLQGSQPADENSQSPFFKYGREWYPLANGNARLPGDTLFFLSELYNGHKHLPAGMRLSFYVSQVGTVQPIPGTRRFMRYSSPEALTVLAGELPLGELEEGSYTLHLLVQDPDGKTLLRKQSPFIIAVPMQKLDDQEAQDEYDRLYAYSDEELNELIPQLYPISNKLETEFARSLRTNEHKRNYFVSFWRKRAQESGRTPHEEALSYVHRLTFANQHYRAGKLPGWKTERGRVLLKYGSPDEVQRGELEANVVTHEIWNYNQLQTQANVIFVFADVSNAGNDLKLIHSNLVGEVFNANWRNNLDRKNLQMAPYYDAQMQRGDNPSNTMRID